MTAALTTGAPMTANDEAIIDIMACAAFAALDLGRQPTRLTYSAVAITDRQIGAFHEEAERRARQWYLQDRGITEAA